MNRSKALLRCILFSGLYCFAGKLWGQESPSNLPNFSAKPNKCISLHKGQLCYQKVRFKWKLEVVQEICIVRASDQRVLICWEGERQGVYEYRFSASKTEVFELRERDSEVSLAQVEIQVASVYRRNKKSATGWRLF